MKKLLILLLVMACSRGLLAQAKPTAYVFEFEDQWTQSLGAAEYLAKAGFDVSPLPLDKSPFAAQVDVIFLGSFASESPAYRDYMSRHAGDLYHYVNKGHLLVQMAQADQTETTPPFLPSTHGARRADQDFARACILSPKYHLFRGLPEEGKWIEFHERVTIWEAFVDQRGFEVALAGDEHAQFPALMEGSYGQGRIILASLALDKSSFGSFGEPAEAIETVREVFFKNLARHAAAVRRRKTEPLNITPPPPKVADFVPGSWTLVLLPDTQIYSLRYPRGVSDANRLDRPESRKAQYRMRPPIGGHHEQQHRAGVGKRAHGTHTHGRQSALYLLSRQSRLRSQRRCFRTADPHE